MAELISAPTRIPVPGGKVIDEYVGRVTTGTESVSVAHMVAPGGWSEPAQQPGFDEVTVVLRGTVLVELTGDDGSTSTLTVPAGQAVVTRAGSRIDVSGLFSLGFPRRDGGEEINARIKLEGRPVEQYTIGERMAYWGVPGVSVAVIDGGEVAWAKAWGVKDVEADASDADN